jgi:cell wall assembly regulator SMI1
METMTLLWQRIERWLTAHAPDLLDELAPGASEEDLIQGEAALGVKLPEDFKALYRLHNGGCFLPPWGERTRPLKSIVQDREMIKEWDQNDDNFFSDKPAGPVQPLRGHPEWIPFFWVGYGGEYLCLDLAPGPGGRTGQVILRPHEYDPARFITNSFEALIAQIADDLEADTYLSFGSFLQVRLTAGKAARDQARSYDEQRASPGKELLKQALSAKKQTEEEPLYIQVLQMPQSSRIDRCRAYHELIKLHLRGQQHSKAERLLTAFESEAHSLPPDHWVYDLLHEDIAQIFADQRVIAYARQAVAEGDEERAFIFLSQTQEPPLPQGWRLVFKPWVGTEEQFEISALYIDLFLRRHQVEAARSILAQFAAQAQTRHPEDPVHGRVRDITAWVQYEEMKQAFREKIQGAGNDLVLELTRTHIASLSPQSRGLLEETFAHLPGRRLDALDRLWLAAMNKLEPDDAESL